MALALILLLALVVPALDYTALFQRTSGWTGADAAYSVPLGDGRTLWLFGDTFFGPVSEEGVRGVGTRMARNSVALQGSSLVFLEQPFAPPDEQGWLWPLDGLSSGPDRAQVFLQQFVEVRAGDPFGFRSVGLWLADVEVSGASVRVLEYHRVPFAGAWGSAIATADGWVYLYGASDGPLRVARVPVGRLASFGEWRFWDGSGWSPVATGCVVAQGVSNELSVHQGRDGWVMISGNAGLESQVLRRTAPAPEGPWSAAEVLFTAPEAGDGVWAYNAKAHPELSDERGLLVSYNVNALDPERVLRDGDLYRPRFVRVR